MIISCSAQSHETIPLNHLHSWPNCNSYHVIIIIILATLTVQNLTELQHVPCHNGNFSHAIIQVVLQHLSCKNLHKCKFNLVIFWIVAIHILQCWVQYFNIYSAVIGKSKITMNYPFYNWRIAQINYQHLLPQLPS